MSLGFVGLLHSVVQYQFSARSKLTSMMTGVWERREKRVDMSGLMSLMVLYFVPCECLLI